MNTNLEKTTPNIILAILKYLRKETTPGTSIKQEAICQYLEDNYGWNVKRQTISNYLSDMSNKEFNLGIICRNKKSKIKKYEYKGILTDEQLSLIADIVCSSSFLDAKTAETMLSGIKEYMSNDREAEFPDVNSYIRPKMLNQDCLDNIKKIHRAIRSNRKIRFYYADMDSDKQLYYYTLKRSNDDKYEENKTAYKYDEKTGVTKCPPGPPSFLSKKDVDKSKQKLFYASPYKLIWDSSKCYLVAGYYDGKFNLINYRVDRMFEMEVCGGDISEDEGYSDEHLRYIPLHNEFFDDITHEFNTERYLKSTFKMFTSKSGDTVDVTFRAHERIAKSIVDRFGYSVRFTKDRNEPEYFTFKVSIQPSLPFWGWLAQYPYDSLRILSPQSVITAYNEHLSKIYSRYNPE